jgi:hypothetical protein
MEFKNVKEILELLLIKKNNFILEKNELDLLNELQFLLALGSTFSTNQEKTECNCPLNEATIEDEIKRNKCGSCGLPLDIA